MYLLDEYKQYKLATTKRKQVAAKLMEENKEDDEQNNNVTFNRVSVKSVNLSIEKQLFSRCNCSSSCSSPYYLLCSNLIEPPWCCNNSHCFSFCCNYCYHHHNNDDNHFLICYFTQTFFNEILQKSIFNYKYNSCLFLHNFFRLIIIFLKIKKHNKDIIFLRDNNIHKTKNKF